MNTRTPNPENPPGRECPGSHEQHPVYAECRHPDHAEGRDCLDRAVGCSKHCLCCMGELAIPLPSEAEPRDRIRSPLETRYGKATVKGNEWRDCTPYSQKRGESPNTWETRVGGCRIIVTRRKSGEWEGWTRSPETSKWKLDLAADCPEEAARVVTGMVAGWLRDLAAKISGGNSGRDALGFEPEPEQKPEQK